MYIVIDDNRFLQYATPNLPLGQNFTEVEPADHFIKPQFVNGVWVEGATAQEIEKIKIEKETELYVKRYEDGKIAYAQISAEFRLAKLSGILNEEQHGIIESLLIPVRNEVLAGQWISAKQKLEEIGNVIGVDLYNRLHNQISDYITNNY